MTDKSNVFGDEIIENSKHIGVSFPIVLLRIQVHTTLVTSIGSKLLSVVTDASDLPVTDSESDGDSAVEE